MATARISLKPAAAGLAAVLALELAARYMPVEPLLLTGLIRLLDILTVLFVLLLFKTKLSAIGLSAKLMKPGFRTGIAWSAAFGAAAGVAAAILTMAGLSPLDWIRGSLPTARERIVLYFIIGGLLGPLAEEMVYRGILFTLLRRWGLLVAVSGSTLLFALSHSLTSGLPVTQLIGGVVFALAYERSKSLVAPMVIHCSGNMAIFTIGLI